jgi:hypothetical protein
VPKRNVPRPLAIEHLERLDTLKILPVNHLQERGGELPSLVQCLLSGHAEAR